MVEFKKFIRVRDIMNAYKESRIRISGDLLERLDKLKMSQFLFVKYSVSSPPKIDDFTEVEDDNIIAFVRKSMKEKDVSLEDLKKEEI